MEWDKDKIRAFRKKKLGLTQYQFAELLGTSQDIISNWETGKQSPCGMSQKFLTLLVFKDIEREIEKVKPKEQKENEISGDTIKVFREKLGLSQIEFAESLGRDASTVSYWESGEKSPGKRSLKRLKELAEKEGIDLKELREEVKSKVKEDDPESTKNNNASGSDNKKKDATPDSTSNRGGANYSSRIKENSQDVKIISSGIDKMSIGYYVEEMFPTLMFRLFSAKKEAFDIASSASNGKAGVPIDIGDYTFNVKSYGLPRYAYILENGDLFMKIAEEYKDSYPCLYVDLKSLFVLENGADEAAEILHSFISSNFGEIKEEKVSKLEIYCDLVGANLSRDDIDKFVSLAKSRATYEENGKFTGFTFGKGDIIGKVYNKTEEIKVHHKEYMYEIWDDVEEGEEVYRVEFEFDRKLLREFEVSSFDSFLQVAGDIWKYLTEDWLSMREVDNENTSRRTLTLLWEVVQGVKEFFGPLTGKVREKKLKKDIATNISVIKGCTTTIGAIRLSEGNSVSLKEVRKEIDFEIDKQLAGIDGEEDFTTFDLSALSEIGFYQSAYRKSVYA